MSYEKTMADIREKLSGNIIRLRKTKGIAQERLGLEAGVDRTVVSKIERKLGNPSLEVLVKLASTLNVRIDELFQDFPEEKTR